MHSTHFHHHSVTISSFLLSSSLSLDSFIIVFRKSSSLARLRLKARLKMRSKYGSLGG
ncbi:hypothetical protein HanXRQr2_Chr02g0080651 [Helianthus annuus]|uniref:Uncharacterized protein n=1 Tax=Helianthus annuus TaxID=4232 RepID=A0A251T1U8_HELAN|nr:hypothetical protein HanXRQr2_Chr02g0080651 [Helianthus annuus]KAJ0952940.1 hypothetical protein HanPSC8_Chr02g0078151 [Helianthus annuus]